MDKPRQTFSSARIPIAILASLFLYLLSFGPACWITARTESSFALLNVAYAPVIWIWRHGSEPLPGYIRGFANYHSGVYWIECSRGKLTSWY